MRAVFAGFDRVQYETHDGEGVTRLTKYIGHVTPAFERRSKQEGPTAWLSALSMARQPFL